MKKFLEVVLAWYAKIVLRVHKPRIIGITGSVGKSSTKEAVALVLRSKFTVRSSPGNLNSQLGLPLAVLGFDHPGGHRKNLASLLEWLVILVRGFFRMFASDFPQILVLEMGTDRPGDIRYLLGIVGHLDCAVITDIGISHLQYFASRNELAREKLSLLEGLTATGTAVLNADNDRVLAGRAKVRSKVITYGFNNADLQASELRLSEKNGVAGMSFRLEYKGARVPLFLPGSLGRPSAYAVMAASAVGLGFGLDLVTIAAAAEHYRTPAGRLKLIAGKNSTKIIDDTYNAAPSSTIAALETLRDLPAGRRLAVLGHMAELGSETEIGHREVAAKIVEYGINLVFLAGEKTKIIEDELRARKFSGQVFWAPDSEALVPVVQQKLLPFDCVLVKGSQSARMERVVRQLMADPSQASKLLVRQGKQWLN